jgi:hypothetical protein
MHEPGLSVKHPKWISQYLTLFFWVLLQSRMGDHFSIDQQKYTGCFDLYPLVEKPGYNVIPPSTKIDAPVI